MLTSLLARCLRTSSLRHNLCLRISLRARYGPIAKWACNAHKIRQFRHFRGAKVLSEKSVQSVWSVSMNYNIRMVLLYYKSLHTEYLTSYTNTLQLIGYQCFAQCKILQILPTHNLHTPHATTRYKHGRRILRHRGTEKSVAPTDFSTSLWRMIHRIRQNRLRDSEVRCVRCMQGCVRYFGLILHTWNLCISTYYTQKV